MYMKKLPLQTLETGVKYDLFYKAGKITIIARILLL